MSKLEHGGRIDGAISRFGGKREDWLDLSTGINPCAWPVPDLPSDAWSRLPDQNAEAALNRVARTYYGVPEALSLVAANGTQALIQLLPMVLKTKEVAILSPTYGEYEHVFGARAKAITDLEEHSNLSETLITVNPNNPTAHVLQRKQLQKLALQCRHFVVDEAFADPMPDTSFVSHMPENTIVLKSFGKFFGLAGVRLGFAVCAPEVAERFRSLLGPWSVSGPALHIGARALADTQWIEKTRRNLKAASQSLAKTLSNAGFSNVTTNPLFVSAQAPVEWEVFDTLAREHILIRAYKAQPGFYRFGLCESKETLSRLESALQGLGND